MPYKEKGKWNEWRRRRRASLVRELERVYGDACECCGERGVPLEWHHVGGVEKAFCVGTMVGQVRRERLMAEVGKCVRLCEVCHAGVTEGARREGGHDDAWAEMCEGEADRGIGGTSGAGVRNCDIARVDGG